MQVLGFILSLLLLVNMTFSANSPGVEWSQEWIEKIRGKIEFLWDRKGFIRNKFNMDKGEYGNYVYDPDRVTVTVDPFGKCADGEKEQKKCVQVFGEMDEKLQFSPAKVLRLVFHDCIPYKGENGAVFGGCDGCLNLDENIKGNMGLQHTAATLEKIYLEADFPRSRKAPKPLEASPKDLGISRSDLWAFAGLVALDRAQVDTRDFCSNKRKTSTATCKWWNHPGAKVEDCYQPFSSTALSMFTTGRTDCEASPKANEFQQYAASLEEDHPDDNGNGRMTVDYYSRAFGFTGREGLALMGIHVLGSLNSIFSGNAYAWTRNNKLFNTQYYQMLSLKPDRVFESCVGTLDDKPAPGAISVISNIHLDIWKFAEPGTWASKEKAGHLRWNIDYVRGPDCGEVGTFGRDNDVDDYWGRRNLFDECCFNKTPLDCFNNATCNAQCTYRNGNKQRFIGADMGYVIDWELVDGVPRGCKSFQNKDGSDMTAEDFRTAQQLTKKNQDVGCPKQMMSDGEGGIMHETVQYFADHLPEWHEAFLKTFIKMQRNGYAQDDLKVNDMSGFWKHMA